MTAYLIYLFLIAIVGVVLVLLDIYIGFFRAIGTWFQDIYWAITGNHRKTKYGIDTSVPRIYWVGTIKLFITIALMLVMVFVLFKDKKARELRLNCETVVSESLPDLVEDLSYVRVVPSVAVASSEFSPASDGTRFDAAMVIDNDLLTSWWENAKGDGKGEWVQLHFDSPVTAAAITIWPGCWARAYYWDSYDEPTSFSISLFYEDHVIGECDVSGSWYKECITIVFEQPIETDSVRVMISDVKKGNGLSDGRVAISEIAVYEKGLCSYVSSSNLLTDEAIEQMKSQAEDDYADHIAETWGNGERMQSFTYLGHYFLTRKTQSANEDANAIYLVYKCDVMCDGHPYSYYHFMRFKNLILNGDGSCSVDMDDFETPSKKVHTDYGYYYYGYVSIDDLFNDCVKRNLATYEFENNVGD